MPVTITVPEKVSAGFVVATNRVVHDLPTMIRQNLPAQFTEPVLERLGTTRLQIAEYQASDSPWDLSRTTAVDEEDSKQAREATRHVGVLSELETTDLPSGLHLARTAAEALAESLCGIPVDLSTDRVLPGLYFEDSGNFILADDWIGASLPPYRNGGECQVGTGDIDGCTCVRISTRGLCRFGLPELEIADVACAHDLAALNVLRTTAQHLLPLGRHPGSHLLPMELRLTSDDFAAFWGSREQLWEGDPVPVRLVEAGPLRLGIEAPDDFPGTMNEWLWDEIPPVMHELLSSEPDDPGPT
ncbi:hypothetical protein [Actinomadura terrae]|uniref:hypothetical protein n=1 Tax=Actinomadura terrae TaxID=604353 RepID=UPI001FA7E88F|nr:hypothetical protein [Actinomadura terrae]